MRRAAAGAVALFLGFGLTWFGGQDRTLAEHRASSQTISAAHVSSTRDDSALLAHHVEMQRLEHVRLEAEREREAEEEREAARLVTEAAERARKAAQAVVTTPTTVRAAPVARTPVSSAPASTGGDSATWAALAQCESGGTNADTGNGYSGYLQFADSTWRSLGYSGRAVDHDYATQIQAGRELQARSGWSQWPACSRQLGLR